MVRLRDDTDDSVTAGVQRDHTLAVTDESEPKDRYMAEIISIKHVQQRILLKAEHLDSPYCFVARLQHLWSTQMSSCRCCTSSPCIRGLRSLAQ